MGAAQRRALERPSLMLSVVPDLLASLPAVDRAGRLGESVATAAAKTRPARPRRHERNDRRRDVLVGKKRGQKVGKTKRGKGTKTMVLADARGLPLAATIASASPHESLLIEPLLDSRILRRRPQRLIYDKAADNDPLRERLARRGVDLIAPHRSNRTAAPTQDGRKLRRYRRRWKIERSISWLQNFRRLVTRYEYLDFLFHGFVQMACMIIVLRQF